MYDQKFHLLIERLLPRMGLTRLDASDRLGMARALSENERLLAIVAARTPDEIEEVVHEMSLSQVMSDGDNEPPGSVSNVVTTVSFGYLMAAHDLSKTHDRDLNRAFAGAGRALRLLDQSIQLS